ncbi:MAG: N-acetyl-gamma-glutamyl-phosphate reductase [Chitinophagaceae bacterium]|nr:N-acetyl-gamma-glutamyl-phosphate reductase [Chitinophagaceae bacterium]
MKKIKAGIIGGAGYTGGELIRLLINHPFAEISYVQSSSNAGKPLSAVHGDLAGETDIQFCADHHFDIDVLFFCSGHGEAKKFVTNNVIPSSVKLIDIGNDFRLAADAQIENRNFVYGLPEINHADIRNADSIANPGCFATAIQLGLLPMAFHGLLKEAYTTGITGSTGAGQSLSATSHFSWRSSNIQAYKTLTHQHLGEITQSLVKVAPEHLPVPEVSFVPWRGDFTRGIFVSSTVTTDYKMDEVIKLYHDFYKDAVFTHMVDHPLHLKQVVNTNKCLIQLEKHGNKLVVHSAIDNLLKGASGQAVQNMNLMFGFPEDAGLKLKASYF